MTFFISFFSFFFFCMENTFVLFLYIWKTHSFSISSPLPGFLCLWIHLILNESNCISSSLSRWIEVIKSATSSARRFRLFSRLESEHAERSWSVSWTGAAQLLHPSEMGNRLASQSVSPSRWVGGWVGGIMVFLASTLSSFSSAKTQT